MSTTVWPWYTKRYTGSAFPSFEQGQPILGCSGHKWHGACRAADLLLRRRRPAGGRQDDQARVVSATIDEPGLLCIVERFLKVRTRKADIAADAFSFAPVIRVPDTEVVELGDECRHTLETVLVDHRPMVPQQHGACQC